jgi:hypothetical protein
MAGAQLDTIPIEGRFLKSRNRKDRKGTKDMKKGKS